MKCKNCNCEMTGRTGKMYCRKQCAKSASKKRITAEKYKDAPMQACSVCGEMFKPYGLRKKTCSDECTKQHKKNLKKMHRLDNPEYYKAMQKSYTERDKAIKAALQPKPKKRTKGEINADMVCLRAVVAEEKKNIMDRESVFRCWRCKKVMDIKHKGSHRQPTCKPCQTKQTQDWARRNPEKYKALTDRQYHRNKADPVKRIIIRFRDLTSKHAKQAGVHGHVKGRKLEYLGCTANELATYLQAQFKRGMSWDNYGRKNGVKCWCIDHIKPVTAFDLTDDQQRKACFHYTNLQPLWERDNIIKGNRTWATHTQGQLILM